MPSLYDQELQDDQQQQATTSATSLPNMFNTTSAPTANTPEMPLGTGQAAGNNPGAGSDPALRVIDSDLETTSGQLSRVLDEGSPLMQHASAQAQRQMAQRGLINSSMAVGAGQQAALNTAAGIANADAGAYRAAGDYNVQAMNQFRAAGLDRGHQIELADIEANYRTLMQANASAGELYQQMIRNVTDITKDPDLNASAKNSAINQQVSMLRTGLDMFGKLNNLDLTSLLNFNF